MQIQESDMDEFQKKFSVATVLGSLFLRLWIEYLKIITYLNPIQQTMAEAG